MIPTIHGLITVLFGVWLLTRGGVLPVLLGTLAAGVFDASAALFLPALGGSSIPPSRLMLVFLLIAMFRESSRRPGLLGQAAKANVLILLFAVWGLIGAFTLPFVFAGQAKVVPMAAGEQIVHLLDVFPLAFSPQNVTTSVYMVGSALTALAAYVAGRTGGASHALVRAAVAIAWVQVLTGVAGITLNGTVWDDVVDFIRNGNYGQLDQNFDNFRRMNGLMPEPSSFAAFTFAWFVVCFECWLRDMEPRSTGLAALAVFVALMISTSTTAYAALAVYGLVVAVRLYVNIRRMSFTKIATLITLALVALAGVIALFLLNPELAAWANHLLEVNTVKKTSSASGMQRTFWAQQGWDMFVLSKGLGVGAGTFRSSGFFQAVLGSVGAIGVFLFGGYMVQFAFAAPAVDAARDADRLALARVAGWAAISALIPAAFTSATPDPGALFAAFAGYSLGVRRPLAAVKRRVGRARPEWSGPEWSGDAVVADVADVPTVPAVSEAPAVPRPDAWRRRAR